MSDFAGRRGGKETTVIKIDRGAKNKQAKGNATKTRHGHQVNSFSYNF